MNAQIVMLIAYLAGIVLVGWPIAELSLWFYTIGKDLDRHRHSKWLKPVRQILFAEILQILDAPRRRRSDKPSSLIWEVILDKERLHDPSCRIKYLLTASFLWPVKVEFILVILIVHITIMIGGLLFLAFDKVCRIVTKNSGSSTQ